MAGRIYLLDSKFKLIAMDELPYGSETLLQKLLADHPDLLAGWRSASKWVARRRCDGALWTPRMERLRREVLIQVEGRDRGQRIRANATGQTP
jgi:hypothetical protein